MPSRDLRRGRVPNSTMKRWQFWLGIGISLIFLYVALRGLHIADVWQVLKTANYWWVIPGVAVYFLGVWARAWRWRYLLRPIKLIATRDLFPTVVIGYMGNNIYPARIGEVLRSYVLRRDEGVAMSASLATIVVERIFDGVVMLSFVFLNLPRLATLGGNSGFVGTIQTLAVWGAGIFFAALVFFLLAAMFPEPVYAGGSILTRKLAPVRYQEKILGLAGRFMEGLASLRSPVSVLIVFLISLLIWLFETAKYWFLMHAFPFQVDFFTLMLMNGIVNLATTIPSAPGYVGTFDAPGIAVLKAAGVMAVVAAAYTLALHAALWPPVTLLGFYYLARKGLKWTDVQAAGAGEAPAEAG
jgi:glycosyltransferase 2 family protein